MRIIAAKVGIVAERFLQQSVAALSIAGIERFMGCRMQAHFQKPRHH